MKDEFLAKKQELQAQINDLNQERYYIQVGITKTDTPEEDTDKIIKQMEELEEAQNRLYDKYGMGVLTITQYLRPNGKKRDMSTDAPLEIIGLAEDMILSVEVNDDRREVYFYGRYKDQEVEEELIEICENSNEAKPDEVLFKLVREVAKRREDG